MWRRIRGWVPACVVVVSSAGFPLSLPGSLLAQVPGGPEAKPPRLDGVGTINDMRPSNTPEILGWIQMKASAGDLWALQVTPKTKVTLSGGARAEFVQPGMFVRLTADFDTRRGTMIGKVEKCTLFTPSEQNRLGVFPDQGAAAGGLGGPAAGGLAANPVARNGNPPPVARFQIAGQIQAMRRGKVTIFCGVNAYFRPTLEVEFVDEPEIQLDLSGPQWCSLAKPGDKITVRGVQLGQNRARLDQLTIQLAEPLGPAEPPARRTRSPRIPRQRNPKAERLPFDGRGGQEGEAVEPDDG